MLFKHAGESGAKIFDQTKVDAIEFENDSGSASSALSNPGKPVAATWKRKDGTTGRISFKYFVDASGRQGLLSTKYLKNRHYNQGLKNIANWAYWKGAGAYGKGTKREGSPYFEALKGKYLHKNKFLEHDTNKYQSQILRAGCGLFLFTMALGLSESYRTRTWPLPRKES